MVSVVGLSHSFGKKAVLRDISFEVNEGEVLAIMGNSGGGKTTLLRCISGLIAATAGDIVVAGTNVRTHPDEARHKMGMVFQSAALFDYMNVADNILFGPRRWFNHSDSENEALVEEMLLKVGLEGSGSLMPSELSGGMRKRVGIARALALRPKVMLYDEPTTGLDPITTYAIDHLVVDVAAELGITSLVVSHDVSSVFRSADRVAFLHQGELAFMGSKEDFELSGHPAIREVIEKSRAEDFLTSL